MAVVVNTGKDLFRKTKMKPVFLTSSVLVDVEWQSVLVTTETTIRKNVTL